MIVILLLKLSISTEGEKRMFKDLGKQDKLIVISLFNRSVRYDLREGFCLGLGFWVAYWIVISVRGLFG